MTFNTHYALPNGDACYIDPVEMPTLVCAKNMTNRHMRSEKGRPLTFLNSID